MALGTDQRWGIWCLRILSPNINHVREEPREPSPGCKAWPLEPGGLGSCPSSAPGHQPHGLGQERNISGLSTQLCKMSQW